MWKKKSKLLRLQKSNDARKVIQADSVLVKIHYSDLRILFLGEGIPTRSRTVKAPVAFLSLGPRYLDGGCCP